MTQRDYVQNRQVDQTRSEETLSRITNINVAIVVLIGVLFRLYFIFSIRLFQEDALITLRYGKMLWSGEGFVYNPGERVLGATSPLWTVLTGIPAYMFSPATARTAVSLVSLGLFVALVIQLIRLGKIWAIPPAAIFVGIAAISLQMVPVSISGMEMSLFVLLIVSSLKAFSLKQDTRSFSLAAIATLTRPEGVIWSACVGLFLLRRHRRIPWKPLVTYVIILLPWVFFSTQYFGSPIPQSAQAKTRWVRQESSIADVISTPEEMLVFWGKFARGEVPNFSDQLRDTYTLGITIVWILGLVWASNNGREGPLLAGVFFVAYVCFFYFGQADLFPWYFFPSAIMFVLVAAVGAGTLIQALPKLARYVHRPALGLPLVNGAYFGYTLLLIGVMILKIPDFHLAQDYENNVRQPAGEYLANCTPDTATIMLEPLGYVGFYSERYLYDLVGLISPELAGIRAEDQPGWPLDVIRRLRPDYLLLRQFEVRDNAFWAAEGGPMFLTDNDRAWFSSNYALERHFEWSILPELSLELYRRTTLAPSCSTIESELRW